MADILSKILSYTLGSTRPNYPKQVPSPPEQPELVPELMPKVAPYERQKEIEYALTLPSVEQEITQPLMPQQPIVPLPTEEVPETQIPQPEEYEARPKTKEEQETWFQKVIGKGMEFADWIETNVDAPAYGLVKAWWQSLNWGVSIGDVLDVENRKDKDGNAVNLWQASSQYTKEAGTWERLIGEIIFSPFNLLTGPVVGTLMKPLRALGITIDMTTWAGRAQAKAMSAIARGQYAGKRWTSLVYPFEYTERGLATRVEQKFIDWTNILMASRRIGSNKTVMEYGDNAVSELVTRLQGIANYKKDPTVFNQLFSSKVPKPADFDEFVDLLNNTKIQWADYLNPINTQDMPTMLTKLMDEVMATNAPVKGKVDFVNKFHSRLKTEMSWFLLSSRPAYFVTNTITDLFQMVDRNPGQFFRMLGDAGFDRQIKEAIKTGYFQGLPLSSVAQSGFSTILDAMGTAKKTEHGFVATKGLMEGETFGQALKNELMRDVGRTQPFGSRLFGKYWRIPMNANSLSEQTRRVVLFATTLDKTKGKMADVIGDTMRFGGHTKSIVRNALEMTPEEYVGFQARFTKGQLKAKDLIFDDAITTIEGKTQLRAVLKALPDDATPEQIGEVFHKARRKTVDYLESTRIATMKRSTAEQMLKAEAEDIRKEIESIMKGASRFKGDQNAIDAYVSELKKASEWYDEWASTVSDYGANARKEFYDTAVQFVTPKKKELIETAHQEAFAQEQQYWAELVLKNREHLYKTRLQNAKLVERYRGEPEKLNKMLSFLWSNYSKGRTKIETEAKTRIDGLYKAALIKIKEQPNLNLSTLDLPPKIDTELAKKMLQNVGLDPGLLDDADRTILNEGLRSKVEDITAQFNKAHAQFLENLASYNANPVTDNLDINSLTKLRNTILGYSHREAERTVNSDLFNYGQRIRLDSFLSTLSPFPYWATRYALHWGVRSIENPAQFHALSLIMKTWMEQIDKEPSYLRFSPIVLREFEDGTQLRFSPLSWFFPLGYDTLNIMKYGAKTRDFWDAYNLVQNVVGSYYYPTAEILLQWTQDSWDIPPYESRGTGILKRPDEVMKNSLPQFPLIRSGIGALSPEMGYTMLQKNLFTDEEIRRVIYAIGDAVNSNELPKEQAEKAIERLQQKRYDPIAMRYLSKTLHRDIERSGPRYMGAPVNYWYSDQRNTWEAQKMINPQIEGTPMPPDVVKAQYDKYPGLEVVRGTSVPAGLNKSQETAWKAMSEYFATQQKLQEELNEKLRVLQERFENPTVEGAISNQEYRSRRRETYVGYKSALKLAEIEAKQQGAPLSDGERERFWQETGREIYPRHTYEIAQEEFFNIVPDDYTDDAGVTDWSSYYRARDGKLESYDPDTRAWLEQQMDRPDSPDYDYRKATKTLRKYWGAQDLLLAQNPSAAKALQLLQYYERTDPGMAEILAKSPLIKDFQIRLRLLRQHIKDSNPEIAMYLQKYFGY